LLLDPEEARALSLLLGSEAETLDLLSVDHMPAD
jgi:hypothetical protein